MNILFSSTGRRVALQGCFRESFRRLGINGRIIGIDSSPISPGLHTADQGEVVPRCTTEEFPARLDEIVRRHDIRLIVPTIDTELPVYAKLNESGKLPGGVACISSAETVAISGNKQRTHEWLVRNSFPTVRQTSLREALANRSDWSLPVIAKPAAGSASIGVRRAESWAELDCVREQGTDYIVQEIATGQEHTVNIFVARSGECVCAIPHRRLEVRSGEVSKGITVRDGELIALCRNIAETLPGAYGPLNVQCFVDGNTLQVIEINARFGGGYPLAHRAGGHFSDWLLEDVLGAPSRSWTEDWEAGVVMLRYDDAVFLSTAHGR